MHGISPGDRDLSTVPNVLWKAKNTLPRPWPAYRTVRYHPVVSFHALGSVVCAIPLDSWTAAKCNPAYRRLMKIHTPR
jgi:hypothetical protein